MLPMALDQACCVAAARAPAAHDLAVCSTDPGRYPDGAWADFGMGGRPPDVEGCGGWQRYVLAAMHGVEEHRLAAAEGGGGGGGKGGGAATSGSSSGKAAGGLRIMVGSTIPPGEARGLQAVGSQPVVRMHHQPPRPPPPFPRQPPCPPNRARPGASNRRRPQQLQRPSGGLGARAAVPPGAGGGTGRGGRPGAAVGGDGRVALGCFLRVWNLTSGACKRQRWKSRGFSGSL